MHTVRIAGRPDPVPVGKIVCLGRNYAEHIRELGNAVPDRPVLFMKPAASIVAPGGVVTIPDYSRNCHHEVELAVLIGTGGKEIAEAQALAHVAGYAVAVDLTLRDVQDELKSKGLPWELAKAFDTSCPLSDFVPAARIADPDHLELRLAVNGELRQHGNTAQMLRPVARIVSEVSTFFTLEAGDILLTGTPAGVGPLQRGDRLDAEIDQVGRLSVSVR